MKIIGTLLILLSLGTAHAEDEYTYKVISDKRSATGWVPFRKQCHIVDKAGNSVRALISRCDSSHPKTRFTFVSSGLGNHCTEVDINTQGKEYFVPADPAVCTPPVETTIVFLRQGMTAGCKRIDTATSGQKWRDHLNVAFCYADSPQSKLLKASQIEPVVQGEVVPQDGNGSGAKASGVN